MIYFWLFFEFFKIGLFTFGGGYAMIPLIKEVVIDHQWLSENEFYDFIGVCESTPGPIAVNMATYIGSVQGGIFGSVLATLGVVLPSFIIIIIVSSILKHFIKNKYFQMFLEGVKPIIIGLILATGMILLAKSLGYSSLKESKFNFKAFIIMLILVIQYLITKYVFKKKTSPIFLIIMSGILGIVIGII